LLTATPPRCSEFLMPGLGKAGTVRGSATVSPARSQEIYQRYAVALYRQALLNLDDPAPAGRVACDPLVNECALAAIPGRGEDDARYGLGYIRVSAVLGIHPREMAALLRAVLRKLATSPPGAAEDSDHV
jgi:hypothetical protein